MHHNILLNSCCTILIDNWIITGILKLRGPPTYDGLTGGSLEGLIKEHYMTRFKKIKAYWATYEWDINIRRHRCSCLWLFAPSRCCQSCFPLIVLLQGEEKTNQTSSLEWSGSIFQGYRGTFVMAWQGGLISLGVWLKATKWPNLRKCHYHLGISWFITFLDVVCTSWLLRFWFKYQWRLNKVYCRLRVIFKIVVLGLFRPDWIPYQCKTGVPLEPSSRSAALFILLEVQILQLRA